MAKLINESQIRLPDVIVISPSATEGVIHIHPSIHLLIHYQRLSMTQLPGVPLQEADYLLIPDILKLCIYSPTDAFASGAHDCNRYVHSMSALQLQVHQQVLPAGQVGHVARSRHGERNVLSRLWGNTHRTTSGNQTNSSLVGVCHPYYCRLFCAQSYTLTILAHGNLLSQIHTSEPSNDDTSDTTQTHTWQGFWYWEGG